MIRLIGLAGEARCGKSSAARFLQDRLGYEQYALSSPIKKMINALFGWDLRHAEGDLKETVVEVSFNRAAFLNAWNECNMPEVFGLHMDNTAFIDLVSVLFGDGNTAKSGPYISPRRAYQLFGTEFARGGKPTIWLDLAERKLNDLPESSGLIITDVRFPNEHKWVTTNKGFVVHVRRAGVDHVIQDKAHESEAGLRPMTVDWQTPFCENLDQLEANINRVAEFAKYGSTSDVALSRTMPSFEQVYGDRANAWQ